MTGGLGPSVASSRKGLNPEPPPGLSGSAVGAERVLCPCRGVCGTWVTFLKAQPPAWTCCRTRGSCSIRLPWLGPALTGVTLLKVFCLACVLEKGLLRTSDRPRLQIPTGLWPIPYANPPSLHIFPLNLSIFLSHYTSVLLPIPLIPNIPFSSSLCHASLSTPPWMPQKLAAKVQMSILCS